ncbi:MAG: hypothetical protein ACJAW3_000818 [Lentimonas sp.]|jgi:hypothetical protein
MITRKKKIAIFGILVALSSVYFAIKFAVPHFLEPKINKLLEQEFGPEAKAQHIIFEPFRLVLKLRNVNLGQHNYLKKIHINFSFPDFIQKTIKISDILLFGLDAEISDSDLISIKNKSENLKNYLANNQKKWKFNITEIKALETIIISPKNNVLKIKRFEIEDLEITQESSLKLTISFDLNHSGNVYFKGKISNLNDNLVGYMSFRSSKLDLNFLNLTEQKIGNIGDIQGELSVVGEMEFDGQKINSKMKLELENLFLYSKDLEMINYFAKKVVLKEFEIEKDGPSLKLKSNKSFIQNLLLSKISKEFEDAKLSTFSLIEIDNIEINHNPEIKSLAGIINFRNDGLVNFSHEEKEGEKNFDLKINNLDLKKFSEALEPQLKYQISSGKLALNIFTTTQDNKIKGFAEASLSQIVLDAENNSSISPESSILLLKNDDGKTGFKFDISGNENDLDLNPLIILERGLGSFAISKTKSALTKKIRSTNASSAK